MEILFCGISSFDASVDEDAGDGFRDLRFLDQPFDLLDRRRDGNSPSELTVSLVHKAPISKSLSQEYLLRQVKGAGL